MTGFIDTLYTTLRQLQRNRLSTHFIVDRCTRTKVLKSSIVASWQRNYNSLTDIYYCLTVTALFLYVLIALPAQSFSGPNPLGLVTIFYCLRFETSFRRLLRLAGSTWRCYTPPPHGVFILCHWTLIYNHFARTTQKTQPILLKRRFMIRCLAIDVLLLRALAPAGMCLPSRCLAVGIHVTILSSHWYTQIFLVVSLLQILVPKLCIGEEGTTFLNITGIHFRPQMVKSYLQLKCEI
jgi:hypothetical protein